MKKIPELVAPKGLRSIPLDYDGYIFISDIDKTYLSTKIESVRGLLKTAFEKPESKKVIPGFNILLRAAQKGEKYTTGRKPLFFISASPPQMEQKIRAKLDIDGIEADGLIFKNQFHYLKKLKFKKLREQVGYKLAALLYLWSTLPPKAKLVLFGDDSESDAIIYSLFVEVLSGNLRGRELYDTLAALKVNLPEAMAITKFSNEIQGNHHPVKAAFINLETKSKSEYYNKMEKFIYPTHNSLQACITLYENKVVRKQAIVSLVKSMLREFGSTTLNLVEIIKDGARRGLYSFECFEEIWIELASKDFLPKLKVENLKNEKFKNLAWGTAKIKQKEVKEILNQYSFEGKY